MRPDNKGCCNAYARNCICQQNAVNQQVMKVVGSLYENVKDR